MEIENLIVCERANGERAMSINDPKRGAQFLRSITPPLPQMERRRKWSAALRDADGWLQLARKHCQRRDYEASREAAVCAARSLDAATLYEEPIIEETGE